MAGPLAWLLTLVAGVIVGGVIAALARGKAGAGIVVFLAAGLIGAAAGRVALAFSFLPWHPQFGGGVLGAIILSVVCWAATRRRPASTA